MLNQPCLRQNCLLIPHVYLDPYIRRVEAVVCSMPSRSAVLDVAGS